MIHAFKMHGTYMVADVNSGAIHVVDEIAYDIINEFEPSRDNIEYFFEKFKGLISKEEIQEYIDEIRELISEGTLYSDDYDSSEILKKNQSVVKALCLHISHDCNLRCGYCFAGTGNFGGQRMNMPASVGKKAIDFLIERSANRKNLEVDFFGGEPLLNFGAVKEIVEYARSREKEVGKKFKFTITTNAVLLNKEIQEYINKNMSNVVLSIDGRCETNDFMRKKIGGQGTYREILPKIKEMAESRNNENYYVRGTFTSKNLDFGKDVLHLADLGFKQVSVEPVVAAEGSGLEILPEHLPALLDEYEALALEYVERRRRGEGFNFFHFMIDLNHGPCVIKRVAGCGAGYEYLAVTPEGDLYPCHQFVGNESFRIGNVNDDPVECQNDLMKEFKDSNIFTKEDCSKCWAKFYCSGGCAANSWQFNKDLKKSYKTGCELEKKRVECALWIQTQLTED